PGVFLLLDPVSGSVVRSTTVPSGNNAPNTVTRTSTGWAVFSNSNPTVVTWVPFGDSVAASAGRSLTDTGLTVTDSVVATKNGGATTIPDTGLGLSGAIASRRIRALTDTGLSTTDSVAKVATKTLTDTGLALSDAVATSRRRSVTDTGLSLT